MHIVLVATMCDKLAANSTAYSESVKEFVAANKLLFWIETSAKTGHNVNELCERIAVHLYSQNHGKIKAIVSPFNFVESFSVYIEGQA